MSQANIMSRVRVRFYI